MGTIETAFAIAAINVIAEAIRVRQGKPVGWKPSPQDIADFIIEIDAADPESEKAAARQRLNLPPDVVIPDSPQAPV